MSETKPDRTAFTGKELELIAAHRTPRQVQRFLSTLPYNWEREGASQRSFREVVRRGEAHCMEAALSAAVMLEQHGYPPLIVSLESKDLLDHVIFVFRHKGLWGAVARSRDIGLHGRKPVFHTLRALAWSYFDPYVDLTARLVGYGLTNLYELGRYDWRFSPNNLWKVENHLREMPHTRLKSSERRYQQLVARFKEFRRTHPTGAPAYFASRDTWML
ncbi:MAG: hypothetical protein JO360_05255 [Acidobacteria bacterium]|nr:hypothetical protein [Acidobacteriota bacterium]